MIHRLIFIFIILFSELAIALPVSVDMQKPLLNQLERLTALLQDNSNCAKWYRPATMIQYVKPHEGVVLVFVKFTINSFNCGNNDGEFFAVFNFEGADKGKPHFELIDFLRIGGKGERRIHNLDARVTWTPKSYNALIDLDVFEMQSGDVPEEPSKKVTMELQLNDWRLYEQKQP